MEKEEIWSILDIYVRGTGSVRNLIEDYGPNRYCFWSSYESGSLDSDRFQDFIGAINHKARKLRP